eukprot:scaffold78990_cov61-Phaeocystis_antarctica.AAC.6
MPQPTHPSSSPSSSTTRVAVAAGQRGGTWLGLGLGLGPGLGLGFGLGLGLELGASAGAPARTARVAGAHRAAQVVRPCSAQPPLPPAAYVSCRRPVACWLGLGLGLG